MMRAMAALTVQDWSALPRTLAPLYERYGRWLPAVVDVVLVLILARILAGLVWALMPTPAAAVWKPAPAATAAANPADRIDINAILSAQLFGQYQAPASPAAHDLATAPDTALNLTLLGILANHGDNASSRALIANGDDEKPYAIGDEVTSGVLLKAIFPDRVVLSRGGRLETLRLDKDKPSTAVAGEFSPAGGPPAPGAESLAQVRNEMLSNPAKAQDFIRIQPAPAPGGGGQIGYRIYPGRDRSVFNDAGLHPGDVVTAINGTELTDPARSLQLLSELSQANQLSLQIQRGGQTQTVNVNLSP
jgi:general secretion pathway protein C